MKSFTDYLKEQEQPSLPWEHAIEAKKKREQEENWDKEYDKHADRGGVSHKQIINLIGERPKD
jgi:hypothetical protein